MERKSYSGFTLLEVLTVISIIGILSAILYPAVSSIIGKARKSNSSNNLRQIALAANSYMRTTGVSRTIKASTPQEWAYVLAKYEGLNNASLYILKDDDLANAQSSQAPEQICFISSGTKSINADFESFPLSYALVSGISVSAPETTTPIAWTRGLQENGYWASKDSSTPGVYGSEGGHIVYLDGHVVYYESLINEDGTGKLVDYSTHRPTCNIMEAISPNATVLESTNN
jgi:prepilin-type N-terminal cleavage/methylation domain-containing protein/prepilin-type processing-associated H-X9-DG protein